MTRSEIAPLVRKTLIEVGRAAGAAVEEMSPQTRILDETGLDSLSLAEVVVRLQEQTGTDPFKNGFVLFRTVGELTALFENALDDRD